MVAVNEFTRVKKKVLFVCVSIAIYNQNCEDRKWSQNELFLALWMVSLSKRHCNLTFEGELKRHFSQPRVIMKMSVVVAVILPAGKVLG